MSDSPAPTPDNAQPDPRAIRVSREQWGQITDHLLKHPEALYFDREIRTFLARNRAKKFNTTGRWEAIGTA